MRRYRVGTFYHQYGVRSFVTAYLRDYRPDWPGCVEYEIQAKDGREAKRVAVARRREQEMARAGR